MEITTTLPSSPSAPAQARRALGDLHDLLPRGRLDDLAIIVSELVTNSVLHGRTRRRDPIHLLVRVAGGRIRVEVTDRGHGFDGAEGDPPRNGGRGLAIVEHLADRWGHERDSRTTVWAELSA